MDKGGGGKVSLRPVIKDQQNREDVHGKGLTHKSEQRVKTNKQTNKNCQSLSSSRWVKLLCKYIQEITRQNYTGK